MPTPPRPTARRAEEDSARGGPTRRGRRPGTPARREGRRGRRWATRACTALSAAVLACAGIGHAVLSTVDDEIARVDAFKDMKNRPEAGHGTNILLVGTDGRDNVSAEERREYRLGGAPCHCTDTIMVVHLSAARDRATVVSLPRDSYAVAPAHTDLTTGERHGEHGLKLNAAYAEGGPRLTLRTVEKMTRLKIDHYLEVDFTSFMKTVDVLGGVRVCTSVPLKDSHSGLDLPAGEHLLNGGQALQYVRARHVDGAADLGRMRRQQHFLAALVDRVVSSGILLHPVRFREATRNVLGSVRADVGLGADELVALGRAMRSLSPASSEFTTVPVGRGGKTVKGAGATLSWDREAAERLFAALREDRPLSDPTPREKRAARPVPVAPGAIRVRVENGTDTEGLGEQVHDALAAAGFRTTGAPVNAPERGVERTVVVHDPRWDRSAASLAAALPGSALREVAGQGATLRVVVGADFAGVRAVRPADPPREPGTAVRGDAVVCGGG